MKTPRVALLVETSNAYARGLLSGIAEYVQRHGPWSVYLPEAGRADAVAGRLRGWKGDGIIVRAESGPVAKAALACGCPLVDLSAAGLLSEFPGVHSDVRSEAAMGFEHLWERGYRNMGFCGVSNYSWVRWQQERFTELAAQAGIQVSAYVKPLRLTLARGWAEDRRALAMWLRKLPRPIGIFTCYDLRGQQLLDACRMADLRVPDDVAVLGVDNDAVRCSLCDPPLTSVAPDTARIGFTAAQLLAQMMAGERLAPGLRFLPPIGVVARRSTDALAVNDPDIAAALRFIRENCCRPINIDHVLEKVPVSRRTLEGRFMKLLGRTPYAEILRCRVDRAKQLLSDTDMPIKAVATRVGVGTPEYLSVLFKRTLGTTPSAYRTRYQNIAPVLSDRLSETRSATVAGDPRKAAHH